MNPENPKDHEEVTRRLKDSAGVQAALKQAARDAVQEHARAGQKIVVWRDNQVVWEEPNAQETPAEATSDR